jgi:hypothetical protein
MASRIINTLKQNKQDQPHMPLTAEDNIASKRAQIEPDSRKQWLAVVALKQKPSQ